MTVSYAGSLLALTLILLSCRGAFADEPAGHEGKATVYVGTYTGSGSKGIYRFTFDPATGGVTEPRLAAEATSPSFLAIDPTGRFLYAVGEVDAFRGQKGGAVLAFAIDPASGDLTALNAQSSGGAGPCHLVIDGGGRNVLVANYGGGSTAVLPVGPDGTLKPHSAFLQHEGSSVNPSRQKGPHAHSVTLDPANRFAFVSDLGLDKVLSYRFAPSSGSITPNDPPSAPVAPGAGPRHFTFHPDGRHAYGINELNSTVTAWSYDPARGALAEIQTVTTLPKDFQGTNYPAEIEAHPSGKFLYGSNRGHDSIVAYGVDPASGRLTLVGHQGHGIKNPRHFTIDPSGHYLLAASQDADTIQVFRIDLGTGTLTPTGGVVKVAKPVCVVFGTPSK